MKIIEKHPKFYTDYKDKTVTKKRNYMYLKGTVVGYCVMYNNKIALMVQTEKLGFDGFFEYFIKKNSIKTKYYHGNESRYFFLVYKEDIECGFVKVDK